MHAKAYTDGAMNSIEVDRVVINVTDGALKVKSILIKPGSRPDAAAHVSKPSVFNWCLGISR